MLSQSKSVELQNALIEIDGFLRHDIIEIVSNAQNLEPQRDFFKLIDNIKIIRNFRLLLSEKQQAILSKLINDLDAGLNEFINELRSGIDKRSKEPDFDEGEIIARATAALDAARKAFEENARSLLYLLSDGDKPVDAASSEAVHYLEGKVKPSPEISPFEEKQAEGSFSGHVVILVHGIRDFALWQNNIRSTLEGDGFTVEVTNYGRFNLIQFLLPFGLFRRSAIAEVWKQLRVVKINYPKAKISVIAHSFGTFIISNIIKQNFDIRFHRVIFCGSVVPYDFEFEQFQDRFTAPILNDVGTRDIWPALAESVTVGYGSAGTYGFRRPLVRDRWHNGAHHGYFLQPAFCKKFWSPFLSDGKLIPDDKEPEPAQKWLQFLSIFKIKWIFLSILLLLFLFFLPGIGKFYGRFENIFTHGVSNFDNSQTWKRNYSFFASRPFPQIESFGKTGASAADLKKGDFRDEMIRDLGSLILSGEPELDQKRLALVDLFSKAPSIDDLNPNIAVVDDKIEAAYQEFKGMLRATSVGYGVDVERLEREKFVRPQ